MQSWPYSIFLDGHIQWCTTAQIFTVAHFAHWGYLRCCCDISSKIFESGSLTCQRSIQSSVSKWIDRLVLVLLPQLCVLCCACASTCAAPGPQRATRAYFTWGVKNPHRKGHFANYWTYNCFGRSCFELWNLLDQPTPPSLNNLFVEYIRIRTFAGLYLTFPSGDGR